MVWKQIIGYIPVNLANLFVGFGSILILTRLLDAAEYGRYALVLITLQMTHTLVFTWMEAAMERFHARAEREGDLRDHLATIYKTGFVSAITGMVLFLGLLAIAPISIELKTILGFAISSTAVQVLVRLGFEAHKAANRITRYSLLYSSQMTLCFTIGIALIMFTPLRVAGPFAGLLIGNLVFLAIDLPFMLKRMKGGNFSAKRSKSYLIYGLPICFSLILEYALSTSDRFVIAYMLTEADVGKYSAGYGLANRSIDVLFIWIGLAVTPMIVRTLEMDGLEACILTLKQYGATLLLVTMPAAVGLGLIAEPASLLLGESVREAGAQLIPWIVGAGVVNGMISYYIQRAFMLGGKTGILPVIMGIPMIINLGLNIALLPTYGFMGAVYATLISYAIGFVLSLWVARRYFPLPVPWEAFLKCGFACIVMAGVVQSLPIPEDINAFLEVVIKGSVGAIVYVFAVFVTNAADCRNMIKVLAERIRPAKVVEV